MNTFKKIFPQREQAKYNASPMMDEDSSRKMASYNFVFILAFIFIIFFCLFSYREIRQLISANLLSKHATQVIQSVDNALLVLLNMETHQRGFLLTSDKQFLAENDASIANIRQYLQELNNLTKDDVEQSQRVNQFISLSEQRLEIFNQTMELEGGRNKTENSQEWLDSLNRGQTVSDHLTYLSEEIKSVELVLLMERDADIIVRTNKANIILIIGNTVSILCLLIAFLLFNREMKKRMIAEMSIKNTESRLNSILASTNDMIAAIDKDYRFMLFNESYQKEFKHLFGIAITTGMSLPEALVNAPEAREKLMAAWEISLEGREYSKNIEFTSQDKKSTYEITSNPVLNNSQIIGAVHILRNVSEKTQAEAEIKKYYEKLNIGMQELQEKNQQITLLVEMSDNMLACASQEELNIVITKFCQRMLNFSSGFLYVMHPSKNYLEVVASWGNPKPQEPNFVPEQCWAIRRGRMHHVGLSHAELVCQHIRNNESSLAYVCIPLMAQNDVYGMLFMEMEAEQESKFMENTKLLVNAFAELTALALANVRLRENLKHQSIRDPLTSLYNRRYLEDFLCKQIHQADRAKASLALLMLDLDHFKRINDSFGHDAGDLVLKEVGQILERDIRLGDIASRYGGEEFIIVFFNTDGATAKERADSIRNAVVKLQIKYGTQLVGPLSISIGISIYPENGRRASDLIETADKALYAAKNSGRNKVILYNDIETSND